MVLETTAASCVWDAAELDRLEDIVREAIARDVSFRPQLEAMADANAFAQAVRMLHDVFKFIDHATNPILALDIVRWKLGVYACSSNAETLSCADIARKYGIRKQAVSQAAKRMHDLLNVRKSAHLRSEATSHKFATTHFRKRTNGTSNHRPSSSAAVPPRN